MANINKIQLPNGTQYDIEDAIAREKVFIITLTNSEDEQTGEMVWSANKTYAQISVACAADKVCIASFTIPEYATMFADLKQITSERAEFVSEEVEVFIYSNGTVTVTDRPYLFHVDCPVTYDPSTGVRTVTLNTSFSDIVGAYNRGRELYAGDDLLLYTTDGMDYFIFTNRSDGIVISDNELSTSVQYFPTAITFDYDSTNDLYNAYCSIGGGFTPSEIELGFSWRVKGITLTFDYINYYPASFKHSGSNYYISFVDPQTGTTKILTAVGDVNEWTLTEIFGGEQSDWEEDDTTDMAHVLNRPAIRTGTGENSVIVGQIEQPNDAAIYKLYLSGSGSTLSYTTEDTLPTSTLLKTYGILQFQDSYAYIKEVDTTNGTITISKSFVDAITNQETPLYYKYALSLSDYSYTEGKNTVAYGTASHAEGEASKAMGRVAHAEGFRTKATGTYSHSEGCRAEATGSYSHSEGCDTVASGTASHAEGRGTIAQARGQHVFGEYNISDSGGTEKGTYIEIVGNGIAEAFRSNARTLDWSGNEVLAGKLTVGAGPVNNMDVATKQYVDQNAGGVGLMVVNISSEVDSQTGEDVFSADKTFAQITAQISVGGDVIAHVGQTYLQLQITSENNIIFTTYIFESPSILGLFINIYNDDTVTCSEEEISGGGVFAINITYNNTTRQYEADKTYSEITYALMSGQYVCCFYQRHVYQLINDYSSYNNTLIFGYSIIHLDSDLHLYTMVEGKTITISNNDSVTVSDTMVITGRDPSDATPLADGVASAGSSINYARGDHVHPKITQTISMSNNVITLTGSDGTTSSVTLPVYNGSVSTGGSSS